MRKDRYVVGYSGEGNVVYGKYHTGVGNKSVDANEDYSQPMTKQQAKRAVKKLQSPCSNAKVFKLVEVRLECL